MGRIKGGKITVTYDSTKRQPLDSRMLVTKRADLINPTIWITNTLTTDAMYNGMIVSVNSDGVYNGVYHLKDRTAVTTENYDAYKVALAAGEDVEIYFSMWEKMGTTSQLVAIEGELNIIKEQISASSPTGGLAPVDGTISITDDGKGISVAIAPNTDNALVAVEGGLFVPTVSAGIGIEIVDNQVSVKLADNAHGLVAVDGALTINLATRNSDGAMSKEDKFALDTVIEDVQDLKNTVSSLGNSCAWGIW